MPVPNKYLADMAEDNIYHIYNRTNNRELLFGNDENRRFFLQRFSHYLSPLLDIFAGACYPIIFIY